MKKIIILFFTLLLTEVTNAQLYKRTFSLNYRPTVDGCSKLLNGNMMFWINSKGANDYNTSPYDGYTSFFEVNSSGDTLWTQKLGDGSYDFYVDNARQRTDGKIVACGTVMIGVYSYVQMYVFDPITRTIVVSKRYECATGSPDNNYHGCQIANDGSIYFYGTARDVFSGGVSFYSWQNPFFTKTKPDLTIDWARNVGTQNSSNKEYGSISNLSLVNETQVAVCGKAYINSGQQLYIAKLDDVGTPYWVKSYNSTLNSTVTFDKVLQDSNGDVYVIGNYSSSNGTPLYFGGDEIAIYKLSAATGNVIWKRVIGDVNNDRVYSAAISSQSLIIGGVSYDATNTIRYIISSIDLATGVPQKVLYSYNNTDYLKILYADATKGVFFTGADPVTYVPHVVKSNLNLDMPCGALQQTTLNNAILDITMSNQSEIGYWSHTQRTANTQFKTGVQSSTLTCSLCNSTSSTINPTACGTYTSPSGKVWTTTNTYKDTISNAEGCDSIITINLTINSIPATPGAVSGSATICSGSSNTYSVTAVSGATSYTWTLPSGWTGTSTTTSITATANSNGGNITVKANNSCGSSAVRAKAITVTSAPAIPGSISGPTTICSATSNTYTISSVSGATSYTWTLPGGWTGTSTTNSITTTSGTTGGNITVTATNACGTSSAQTLAITISPTPATPGAISGTTTICSGTSNTYSVATVSGATSYTWTLPSGWTGTSTTNSITTTAGSTGGNITVTANNSCGGSAVQTQAITVNSAPATPGAISGTTSICSGTSNTYSVATVSGATSYTWTLPSGWTGTSTTNSITTTAGSTGGDILVTANNGCGSSAAQTSTITINTVPAQPSTISGSTTLCEGDNSSYTIPAVSGATSYTWTYPSGWTATNTANTLNVTAGNTSGTIDVTANNACGSSTMQSLSVTVNNIPAQPGTISGSNTACIGTSTTYTVATVNGATSYTWTLPSGWAGSSTSNSITASVGATGGDITVVAENSCGVSTVRMLTVNVSSAPSQPTAITGNTTICSGTTNVYSTAAVSGATTYTWTLPNGWTGSSAASVISTTAGSSSGNITVVANNACGSSSPQQLNVSVTTPPAMPTAISGATSICAGTNNTYSISTVNGATSYTWTLPNGWTGTSTTNSIDITAGTTSGNITVIANNNCGSSTAQTLTVTVNTATTPTFTRSGNTLTSSSASAYQWYLNGSPISGATNQSYTATSNGNYSVKITDANGCEATSAAQNVVLTGISDRVEENNRITVYPNPTASNAILNIKTTNAEAAQINIMDMLGREIKRMNLVLKEGENNLDITMQNEQVGVYYIQIVTTSGTETIKLIKE